MNQKEDWEGRSWMFDPVSGYLVDFSHSGAVCEHTNFRRELHHYRDVKLVCELNNTAFYQRYGLKPLVTESGVNEEGANRTELAETDEYCPKCNRKGLLFFTLQLRSADEGQTVFYECPRCGYKYSQNN